jgi:hypothetical protein
MANVVNSEKSKLMNREEAANFLNVKTQTLAVWACRKIGPAFLRVGRSVKYKLSDLESFLDSSRVTTRDQS